MPAVLGDWIGARGAGCWLAKAKPVDTVVADVQSVEGCISSELLELLALLPCRPCQECAGASGCVGKIEARLSPNCLDMASAPAANGHPTAHVSGSRASLDVFSPKSRSAPHCRGCVQSGSLAGTVPSAGSEHQGLHVVAVSLNKAACPGSHVSCLMQVVLQCRHPLQ